MLCVPPCAYLVQINLHICVAQINLHICVATLQSCRSVSINYSHRKAPQDSSTYTAMFAQHQHKRLKNTVKN